MKSVGKKKKKIINIGLNFKNLPLNYFKKGLIRYTYLVEKFNNKKNLNRRSIFFSTTLFIFCP